MKSELKRIGLRDSEIEVYLYLLSQGLSTPSEISLGTRIARPNCYHILRNLMEKELISESKDRKRKAYLANDPEAFLRLLDKKRDIVEELLPDLRIMHMKQAHKPRVTFYDGEEGLRTLYLKSLEGEEIFAIGSIKKLSESLPDFFGEYLKELKRKEIVFHDLLSNASREKEAALAKDALRGFYSAKFFPSEYGDLPTDILIWDANIALITLQGPMFGMVMENELLAHTFKTLFRALWDQVGIES